MDTETYIKQQYGETVWDGLQEYIDGIKEYRIGRKRLSNNLPVTVDQARNICDVIRTGKTTTQKKQPERAPAARPQTQFEMNDDGTAVASSHESTQIKTLDDLIYHLDLDLDTWKITKHIVNTWPTTAKNNDDELVQRINYQVKAWLDPRYDKICIEEEREKFIEDVQEHAPDYEEIEYEGEDSGYVAEIDVFDAHMGKYGWKEETGEDYDSFIARTRFVSAFNSLLGRAKWYNPDQIIVPVGNDALHIDSQDEVTANGTPQDVDTRLPRLFRQMRKIYVKAIERASQIAPVKVIVVPGNHDEETIFYLGDSLEGWFSKNPQVEIDNRACLTKYEHFGDVLIGYNHGKDRKFKQLPYDMAVEVPQLWSESRFREFHCGHLHKRAKMFREGDEHKGVVVRVLPSIAGTDAWHKRKGHIGNLKAAQSYIWHKKKGLHAYHEHNFPTDA